MNLVLDLPSPLERRLAAEAKKAGVTPSELVTEFVKKNLAPTLDFEEQKRLNAPSIALLNSWIADAPTGPEEIREAEEDLLEFKRNMNYPRKEAGYRLPYPEAE